MFFKFILFILAVHFNASKGAYDKLQWSLCGASDIDILENTMKPMVWTLFGNLT